MVEKHIRMSLEDSLKVKDYAIDRNISINKALNELIKEGLNKNETVKFMNKLYKQINKIYFNQEYSIKLLEQMYSDFEFDNLSNPKLSDTLNLFKYKNRTDKMNN